MLTSCKYTEKSFFNKGFNHLLGMELMDAEPGHAVIRMKISSDHLNPNGVIHGGCLFALADSAGANAAVSYGKQVVTVASDIRYMRLAHNTEYLTATADEVKHGNTIMFFEVKLTTDDGSEVARVGLTYYCLDK